MAVVPSGLRAQLHEELRHRLRPMRGRDADQHRASPIELLYDLTYVIAFAAAAEQLAHHLGEGAVGPAVGAYVFAVFAISWAWMNFTWFASAYGNDDALFRAATFVQMLGVVVLVFGLPLSFSAAAEGGSPNNGLLVTGYVVMRVPLVALWLRAAAHDPRHRRIARTYAAMIAVAQGAWVLTAVLPLAPRPTVALLVVVALAELAAPVVAERRQGSPPWDAAHIAERFSLLTLITLGEVVAATIGAVAALTEAQGWSAAPVIIAACGLLLAATLWWAYFLIPSRAVLALWPSRVFAWRYAHLPIFGAVVAIGAGLRVAAGAVEDGGVTLLAIALGLVVPVGAVLVMVFATWSVLMHARDLAHVPLFLLNLAPLVAAVVVAARAGGHRPFELGAPGSLGALTTVLVLVALAGVVEVVGHERVGLRHTLRAVERGPEPEPRADLASAP